MAQQPLRYGLVMDEIFNLMESGEAASLIGTTKRHLNRILKKWSEEEVVIRNGDTLQILNWEKLKYYANDVRFE